MTTDRVSVEPVRGASGDWSVLITREDHGHVRQQGFTPEEARSLHRALGVALDQIPNRYRLSDGDEWLAKVAMRRAHKARASHDEIVAAGVRAIGVTRDDLRDVELAWVDNEAGEIELGVDGGESDA